MSNSITTKEDQLLHSNLIDDWRNGLQHTIPVQANFTLFDVINITPSLSFTDRMYTKKINRSWDDAASKERTDTIHASTTSITGACRWQPVRRYMDSGHRARRSSATRSRPSAMSSRRR